jgi:hypothetical protein
MGISYNPKSIDIKSIAISNMAGQLTDIRFLLLEFSVYEDIFTNCMKAEFILEDTVGLIERLPIVGDEFITLRFGTPTKKEILSIFRVYKISDRKQTTERTNHYVLHGISPQLPSSLQQVISKSYVNKKIDSIVQSVYNEYFPASNVNKNIIIEPTKGITTLIAPRVNPFEFINTLTSEAQSEANPDSGMYLFFEDHENFNFVTVNTLIKAASKKDYYYADPGKEQTTNAPNPDQIIYEIDYKNFVDTLTNNTVGLYDNTVIAIDPILRRFEYYNFNYEKDFNKLANLGPGKLISRISDYKETGSGATQTKMLITNIEKENESYGKTSYFDGKLTATNDPYTFHPRKRHLFLPAGTAQIASLKQMITNVAIPGDSERKAGDIIRMFIPQQTGEDRYKTTYNKFFGTTDPKFLVTAVTHRYKAYSNEYVTLLQCVKNAFAKEALPE